MLRPIISRTIWTFVILTNITALAGLLELLNPKEQQVAFIWNTPVDWIPILLGLAIISLLFGVASTLLKRSSSLPAK